MKRREELGPLATLEGRWEGVKGHDTSPDANPKSPKVNLFKEVIEFDYIGGVDNHAQKMQGLKYSKKAWRIGEADSFHEECGYWLWDAKEKQAMRCFVVPRGVTVIAGGTVDSNAKEFTLSAEVGSETYGICSNLFLDREFKTVGFNMTVKILNNDSFTYEEDSILQIKGQANLFHHVDKNTLTRIKMT